jgi:NitT/TauT family transport system substrate-binding protein
MIGKLFRKCLLTAAAVACLTLPAMAEAGKIRLGMTTWVGYGPLFLARDMGFFKEAGVDVELTIIEEASLYMAAVAGGDLDGAASAPDELMKYRSNELCFKYVVALDDSHGGDGVVTQADVNSLKDLKGKEVGLNEGSVSDFWFNILLKKEGMTKADVKATNMTADDAAAAFIAGRIPAAVTWEPHLSLVRTQNKGKVLIDSSSTPGVIVDVVALKCDIITNQAKDVEALVKGYYRAIEMIKTDPAKSYEIMAKGVGGYLSTADAFAEAAKGVRYYDRARNIEYFGTPAASEMADLIKLGAEIWGADGKLKMDLDYATLVDPSFIKIE